MPEPRKPKSRRKRRARGTGQIFHDARRKVWVARVPVGRYPSGRTRYREVSAPTQAAAVELQKGVLPPGPDTTVREWAERWFAALTVRPSTRDDYRNTLDVFVLPTFGHRSVRSLTSHDVEAAAQSWSVRLGPNTLRKNLAHFRACLQAACRAKLIPDNPVSDAKKPRAKKPDSRPFTPAELVRIIDAGTDTRMCAIFATIAGTGLRIGEALALDVSDFDAAAGTLAITKTYSREHGLRAPKSENGVRTIRVPDQVRAALEAAADYLVTPTNNRGLSKRRSGPLFPGRSGGRREYNTVGKCWRKFLARLGLDYRGLHQMRHSVATSLVAAGVPIADVAKYLGDSIGVVVSRYLHPTGADPARAMEDVLRRGRSMSATNGKAPKPLKNKVLRA